MNKKVKKVYRQECDEVSINPISSEITGWLGEFNDQKIQVEERIQIRIKTDAVDSLIWLEHLNYNSNQIKTLQFSVDFHEVTWMAVEKGEIRDTLYLELPKVDITIIFWKEE